MTWETTFVMTGLVLVALVIGFLVGYVVGRD